MQVERTLEDIEQELQREISKLRTKACEKSLAEFTKQAWHVIEPGTPLEWNWHLDTICGYLEATASNNGAKRITRLIINVPPGTMKSILVSVMFPAWLWIRQSSKRIIGIANIQDLAIRDARRTKQIVENEWYQDRWPLPFKGDQSAKTNYENTQGGFRQSLGITANITGKRGNYILMDDLHDASDINSDLQRQAVLDIYDEKVSTRVNQQAYDVIILIMQRLHHMDITGHLLSKKKTKWIHVVMPMHYDSAYTYSASKDLGRPELDDPRTEEGELLFPAMFPTEVVEKLEEDMGSHVCTPKETPILMADLAYKLISEIVVGDKVIGWNKSDIKGSKSHLCVTTVEAVNSYADAEVYTYTTETGSTVRCTPAHKWYVKDKGKSGFKYSPITVGKSRLAKARKPIVQDLTTRDQGLSRWLAGFIEQRDRVVSKHYDGKETVYALTTGTNNYVAWGYASSNSAGQLEQRPSVKGGGIMRQGWFRVFNKEDPLPVCEHIFISCDTAYSERDMVKNSYSAFTTWGVFWNKAQERDCILLLDMWYDRVDYPELRRKAMEMNKDKQPDVWLIEKKASGQSLVQDLRQSGLHVRTYQPDKDKVTRAYSIQAMLESGQVWIPDRKWAHKFTYLMSTFPTGVIESMDLADTFTQAMIYIRNGWYVTHPDDEKYDVPEVKRRSAYGGHLADTSPENTFSSLDGIDPRDLIQ